MFLWVLTSAPAQSLCTLLFVMVFLAFSVCLFLSVSKAAQGCLCHSQLFTYLIASTLCGFLVMFFILQHNMTVAYCDVVILICCDPSRCKLLGHDHVRRLAPRPAFSPRYRFAEIRYLRADSRDKPARVETVVLFLPDVWRCSPSRLDWMSLQKAYAQKLQKKLNPDAVESEEPQALIPSPCFLCCFTLYCNADMLLVTCAAVLSSANQITTVNEKSCQTRNLSSWGNGPYFQNLIEDTVVRKKKSIFGCLCLLFTCLLLSTSPLTHSLVLLYSRSFVCCSGRTYWLPKNGTWFLFKTFCFLGNELNSPSGWSWFQVHFVF